MAVLMSLNNSVGSGNNFKAFLYRLYQLFDTGGTFNSHWTIIDSSGTWTSESSATVGAYYVIRCTTAWTDDSTTQEFLFGYATGSTAIGGYTGANGINIVGAPKGGWNNSTKVFDSVNTGVITVAVNASPCAWHGWSDGQTILVLTDNNGSGNWATTNAIGLFLGKLNAADSISKPWACMFQATSGASVESTGFSSASLTTMKTLLPDESSCQNCHIIASSHTDSSATHSAKDGKYRGFPLLQVKERAITNATIGDWPQWVKRINRNIAGTGVQPINGSVNVCIGGLVLPWQT